MSLSREQREEAIRDLEVYQRLCVGTGERLAGKRIHSLNLAIAALRREEDGWQPIETAPEGVECFIYDRRYSDTNPIRAIRDDGRWFFASAQDCEVFPSHWRPLPLPPSVDPLRKTDVKL